MSAMSAGIFSLGCLFLIVGVIYLTLVMSLPAYYAISAIAVVVGCGIAMLVHDASPSHLSH